MSVRKAISFIKRQEQVKVIISSRRNVLEEYKREMYDLNDISINDSENIEIICNKKIIEIPVEEINKVVSKSTYVVFHEDLIVILFNFISK